MLLSIVIGTLALPLVVKGEDEEKEYTQYSLREKILEGTLEELKERDISKKIYRRKKLLMLFEIKKFTRNESIL